MALQVRRADEDGALARVRDRRQEVRLNHRKAVRTARHLVLARDLQHVSNTFAVFHRELEKATTRTHNREKPYSAKAARKTLYERVRDPSCRHV